MIWKIIIPINDNNHKTCKEHSNQQDSIQIKYCVGCVFSIHVACWWICVLFYVSCVCLHVCAYAVKSKVHCGSAFEPGASGLPYYFTPPLFFPDVIGGLAVWRHNNPKKKRGRYAVNLSAVNWEFGHFESQHPFLVTLPKNCTILVYFHLLLPIPSPKVNFISTSICHCCIVNCTYRCRVTGQWSYGSDMCAGLIFPTSGGLGLVQTSAASRGNQTPSWPTWKETSDRSTTFHVTLTD